MSPRLGPLGAPLAIMLVWVAVRVAILAPEPEPPRMNQKAPPVRDVVPVGPAAIPNVPLAQGALNNAPLQPLQWRGFGRIRHSPVQLAVRARPGRVMEVTTGVSPAAPPLSVPVFQGRSGTVAGYLSPDRQSHRTLTGSGWALVNGTGGTVGVPSLGGSQTGLRLFLQGKSAPLALTARVSRALGSAHGTEVSAGYGLRARGLGLLVERRERLDVKSGAFVVTGYGGVYDVSLPAGLRFDGFAQGGVAGVRSRRWFADGQARVTARAALSPSLSFGAGGGAWASAQEGARRVEAGPLVEARIRSGALALRVAGEYRLRLTGDANPRSGPALTVGVDF